MESLVILILFFGLLWIAFQVLKKMWPFLKFGIFFGVAFLGFGLWFILKEASPLGMVLGVVAVFVGAWRYAKSKVN